MKDSRLFENRPVTDSQEWQDYVMRIRLSWPPPITKEDELDRALRIVAVLSDIANREHRHRSLQGFVHSLLAPKKAGKKRANQDEKYLRRDLKIFQALESIRQRGLTLDQAKEKLLEEPRKHGFGPDDDLPGFEGINEADRRARKLWGLERKRSPRRKKKNSPNKKV